MTRRRRWGVAVLALLVAGAAPRDAGAQRLNPMTALLEAGETVFGPIWGDKSPDGGVAVSRNNELDYIFYDMEHAPLDITQMRTFMQFMVDPGRILRRGQPGWERTVLVRIPAYGREMNQWMIKNILDQGAHGIIAPHIETAEQALHVVRSMRYPQRVGSADMEPAGQRGSGAGNATRFWGVGGGDYLAKADLWPLDPDGELLVMIQIENQLGVANVEEIARVPGVSMLMAAPSDLGMAYGGDGEAAERAIQRILAVSKAAGIPCAITASVRDVERRVEEGFRVIIASGQAVTIGRRAAGRE